MTAPNSSKKTSPPANCWMPQRGPAWRQWVAGSLPAAFWCSLERCRLLSRASHACQEQGPEPAEHLDPAHHPWASSSRRGTWFCSTEPVFRGRGAPRCVDSVCIWVSHKYVRELQSEDLLCWACYSCALQTTKCHITVFSKGNSSYSYKNQVYPVVCFSQKLKSHERRDQIPLDQYS